MATIVRAPTLGSPSGEPLTTAEAKEHCDIPSADTSHDTFIASLITAARQKWERDTATVAMTTTVTEKRDDFGDEMIELARRPVASVTSIYYYSQSGSNTLLASDQYALDTNTPQPLIVPAYGVTWPVTRGHYGDVTITYVAGYSSSSNVPKAWKQAMLLLISHWFEHRSAVNFGNIVNDVPQAYESLVAGWQRSTYP